MKKITVNASSVYDIFIGENLLKDCGKFIRKVSQAKCAAVVTDDVVDGLYAEKVIKSLAENGYKTAKFVFKNGEASKCEKTLFDVYDFLNKSEITRSDLIIALGGGVVGDLTGFAAATFLRGVDFVQIPTTFLAQIDSSIGGKTAIDLPSGKNLVGAFKQPKLVICDILTLDTLSAEIFSDGMGEAIKYGMIKNSKLFELFENGFWDKHEEEIIFECVSIKKNVVENDEFESGERMLLNFGHTLGHAIEKYFHFTGISHGKAVGIGMCLITQLAEGKNLCKAGTLDRLIHCLQRWKLPTECEISIAELAEFCLSDKKRDGENLNIVICDEVGKSRVIRLSIPEFYRFLGVENGR
ncbi:MAG: 3-dehydroquinate synthase [Oscillospiraceae bacterium]